tara:strand:+ start:1963 stop:4383 length:2421 start_codon:yes stop_codon:yes gene_type:complete
MSIFKKNWKEEKTDDGYKQSLPTPNDLPSSWMANEYRIYTGGTATGDITKWHNPEGQLTHYTYRRQDKSGKKMITPHTFHTNGNGAGIWKQKGWKGEKYFHDVHMIPGEEKPLLVVEGEKVMHFCNNDPVISKQFKAITWYGGVKNLTHFNIDCLKDKEVWLCPDNDEPGKEAMWKLGMKIMGLESTVPVWVDIPKITQTLLPHDKKAQVHYDEGWDLADGLYPSINYETVFDNCTSFHGLQKKEPKYWEKIKASLEDEATDKEVEKYNSQYAYVMSNDMFNKLGTTEFYNKQQIDNFHLHQFKKGLTVKLLTNPNTPKAETFVTLANYPPGIIEVKKDDEVYGCTEGTKVLNVYMPNKVKPVQDDLDWLFAHFKRLLGQDKWNMVEQKIAFLVQHPGVKVKWAEVIVSAVEGTGKGLLARIVSSTLGASNVNENANYKHLTNNHNTLLIGKQVVVLNELSLGDFKGKMEGTNTLKNFIGDDHYTCNFKGKPMVTLPNKTAFMLFSNDPRVFKADNGGRRYYFINITISEQQITDITNEGYFDRAWQYVDSERGKSALLYHFKNIKIEDPSIFLKRAPITDDLLQLREQSKHPVQKKLEYELSKRKVPNTFFHGTPEYKWFSGLIFFDELNRQMSAYKEDGNKYDWGSYGDDAIYKFLEDNCIPWNNGENTRQIEIEGTRRRMYILADETCYENKSFKDLTPKQIEKHYLYRGNMNLAIYKEAEWYKKALAMWDSAKKNREYKGMSESQIRSKLINSDDDKLNRSWRIILRIIDRGIRPRDQIADEFDDNEYWWERKTMEPKGVDL